MIAHCKKWVDQIPTSTRATFEMVDKGDGQASPTGYGAKIKTPYMVKVAGRWRRVYAACWGYGATYYIGKVGAYEWTVEGYQK